MHLITVLMNKLERSIRLQLHMQSHQDHARLPFAIIERDFHPHSPQAKGTLLLQSDCVLFGMDGSQAPPHPDTGKEVNASSRSARGWLQAPFNLMIMCLMLPSTLSHNPTIACPFALVGVRDNDVPPAAPSDVTKLRRLPLVAGLKYDT